ncbi:hypothetical protein [Shimia sp.]|nr:hypothetical protein [Shimia sp.]
MSLMTSTYGFVLSVSMFRAGLLIFRHLVAQEGRLYGVGATS